MQVTALGNWVTVSADVAEKRIPSESAFWYALKKKLQSLGHDAIKKLMSKDHHLVSDGIYYVRHRKGKWMIHDGNYALRLVHEEYNKTGQVRLCLVGDFSL